VGSKESDQIQREYGKYVLKKLALKEKKQITFNEAEIIGNEIINLFRKDAFDKCILFYNNFKNVITQIPQAQQIIPAEKKSADSNNEKNLSYEFEPDEDEILEELLPKNISTQIFKAFLENAASEQGSRMTAIDNATRNARDLIDKLTINYNKNRQPSITKKLIKIISGTKNL
jgi:F0F1-type ATP synthase, gamma subunit